MSQSNITTIGPKSGVRLYYTNQSAVSLLDELGVIGKVLLPTLEFELIESMTDETYTLYKKQIYICLKDAQKDLNTLVYVFLHELTHCVAKNSRGHDSIFIKTFQQLKLEASQHGYFKPIHVYNKDFCGVKVTY